MNACFWGWVWKSALLSEVDSQAPDAITVR
jgi:hypothetical protein